MNIDDRKTAFLSTSNHFQSNLLLRCAIIIKTLKITNNIIELLIISETVKIFDTVEESTKYLFPTAANMAPTEICDLASKSSLGI